MWFLVLALGALPGTLCRANDSILPPAILIAQARLGTGFAGFGTQKLEAAITLAVEVSGRYTVVPALQRDSVIEALQREGLAPTVRAVAQRLGCTAICFALAERFVHLVRVEVVLRWAPEYESESRGVGYALARYARVGSGEPLYDPALLEATQRAFALCVGDSTLYATHEPPLRVYPAPLLAVSSISYSEEPGLPPWQLFRQKVVSSYDAVLNAIDTARHHPRFVVCDIDTRDSIYALGRLREPENYNPPTALELELLANMGVEYLLAGSFQRTSEGAHLRMELYRLSRVGQAIAPELIAAADTKVHDDSVLEFRRAVRKLVGQLLWQQP
ncbi:MAG: hypothetical protein NZ960_02080 [Candidatus Kapabacteria bacterium]|nr:hypothetical protein [Candidatus Kapabacteria bacterium]MDW8011813.1 hypothetical protein [Bacteroidota bacterium]